MTAVLEGSAAHPGRTLLPGKTRYPFYRRLGGPQGRSGRAINLVPTGIRSRTVQPGRAENLVPTGIRSRTVQPVAQSLFRLSYPTHILCICSVTEITSIGLVQAAPFVFVCANAASSRCDYLSITSYICRNTTGAYGKINAKNTITDNLLIFYYILPHSISI